MLWPHLLLQVATLAGSVQTASPWRTLIVGGGPAPDRNQVAIEGNVRYVDQLLDPKAPRRVLFADGQRDTDTVVFQAPGGRRLRFRPAKVPRLDGPTTQDGIATVWQSFVAPRPRDPLFVYFTGHGIKNPRGDLDNNMFELWGGGGLTVRQLAKRFDTLPRETPIVVLMVQCFSGSFANVLFENGDPDGDAVDRDIAGFFAATQDRPATGCTPEINEADYRDFTSYFMAALTGRSRTGKAVGGADFDGNGWVGMDEAFAWALVQQETEDVPVSTSDAFLRRYVRQPDGQTMATPYAQILSWATPAQRAALEGLSRKLGLRGESRLRVAYDAQFGPSRDRDEDETLRAHRLRFIRAAKSVVLARALVEAGDAARLRRFQRLRALEAMNPLRGYGLLPPRGEPSPSDGPAVDDLRGRAIPRRAPTFPGGR